MFVNKLIVGNFAYASYGYLLLAGGLCYFEAVFLSAAAEHYYSGVSENV